MKNTLVRTAVALIATAAFGVASATTPAVEAAEGRNVDATVLMDAVSFDRDADLAVTAPAEFASLATTERKCRFTSSRNPLRVRSNECRLA
jgi:hypothetical protein